MDIFCKIVNNELPSYTLYEDDIVKVFLDVNPNHNGHTLIVPKKHYQDFFDIDDETLYHVLKVAKDIAKLLKEKLRNDRAKTQVEGFTKLDLMEMTRKHICSHKE